MPVDFFPALKYFPSWLPGMGFKRSAISIREDVRKMENVLFAVTKENMRTGSVSSSLVSSLVESHTYGGQISEEDERDIKGAAGVLYAASVDSTTSVVATFLLAMLHHPHVYRKAQEEIDRVLGHERLPVLADRGSLPYFEAVLMELYRWHPPLPLGIPHVALKNDIYREYHIPKGALVFGNLWAITQNPAIYDEPHLFRPERFMDDKQLDPREMIFGFGRRICPGKSFGDANVWLAAVSISASLRITKPPGGEIDQPMFSSGFMSHPETFECLIKPRFEETLDLIQLTFGAREI
jgi:cytochrome P450